MTGWWYALWGAFGGFSVAAIHFITVVATIGGPPWSEKATPRYQRSAWLAAGVARAVVGAGFAAAAGLSGYINTEMLALLIGVSAPILSGQATVIARAMIKTIAANLPDSATTTNELPSADTSDTEAGDKTK